MKLAVTTLLSLAFVVLAAPSAAALDPAAEPEASSRTPAAEACVVRASAEGQPVDSPKGDPVPLFPQNPAQQTCSLQIECSDGSVISCMGNNSCSTSPNGLCTICDGVTTACCSVSTCCQECQWANEACISECSPPPPGACRHCFDEYQSCVAGCTGGCP